LSKGAIPASDLTKTVLANHLPNRKMQVSNQATKANQIANFLMFAQRLFLLNLAKELNKSNVSYAQFFLLGYLKTQGYISMTDISKKMGHSTAAATGMVDRLEKLGYVERLHSAEDRRQVLVQITKNGIEILGKVRGIIAKEIKQIFTLNEDEETIDMLMAAFN
jgi:DNA-binding MarR family transcriptional regulator